MSPLRRTLETAAGIFGGGPVLNGDAAAAELLMIAMEEEPQVAVCCLLEPCAVCALVCGPRRIAAVLGTWALGGVYKALHLHVRALETHVSLVTKPCGASIRSPSPRPCSLCLFMMRVA